MIVCIFSIALIANKKMLAVIIAVKNQSSNMHHATGIIPDATITAIAFISLTLL